MQQGKHGIGLNTRETTTSFIPAAGLILVRTPSCGVTDVVLPQMARTGEVAGSSSGPS